MKQSWRLLLAIIGTALLLGMVKVIGPDVVLAGVRRAGWILLPIMAVQFAVYSLNAWSWWLLFDPATPRPSYPHTLSVSITGFGLNFITPVVNAGGEPYRIAALTPILGVSRATGSVLAYVLVHAVSSLMLWFTAAFITVTILPHADIGTPLLILLMVLILVALGVVLSGHRDGVVLRITGVLTKLRFQRLSAWLNARRDSFTAVDTEIVSLWRARPRRLLAAMTIDTLSRIIASLEFYLIASALGMPLPFTTSLAMWGLLGLAMNLFFIFPWELGSREASIYAVTRMAAAPTDIAGLAVVVSRVREVAWAALGMALLWFEARRMRSEK